MIATTAAVHNLTVVTRNVPDFKDQWLAARSLRTRVTSLDMNVRRLASGLGMSRKAKVSRTPFLAGRPCEKWIPAFKARGDERGCAGSGCLPRRPGDRVRSNVSDVMP